MGKNNNVWEDKNGDFKAISDFFKELVKETRKEIDLPDDYSVKETQKLEKSKDKKTD